MKPILEVRDLKTYFFTEDGVVRAVDGVSFELFEKETLGIVGESGSGKSVTSLSILRLLDPRGRIVGGSVVYKGTDLLKLPGEEMRKIRGKEISMIFQEPMVALNPVYTIGDQISEPLIFHLGMGRSEARKTAVELLRKVGIPEPEKRVDAYPHELSGGMRQRAMIAMALACRPAILIADEPTTALDVTIQAQILELMKDLQKEYGMSIIFITHDLGVIAEMADRVAVMYGGKVVEYGTVHEIFKQPRHPYTWELLQSIPRLDIEQKRLRPIRGNVPDPLHFPEGCRFRDRCDFATEKCLEEPPVVEVSPGHISKCWHIDELIKRVEEMGENG